MASEIKARLAVIAAASTIAPPVDAIIRLFESAVAEFVPPRAIGNVPVVIFAASRFGTIATASNPLALSLAILLASPAPPVVPELRVNTGVVVPVATPISVFALVTPVTVPPLPEAAIVMPPAEFVIVTPAPWVMLAKLKPVPFPINSWPFAGVPV
ncbi:hypothetical protein D3C87_1215680 [compost metagenome]